MSLGRPLRVGGNDMDPDATWARIVMMAQNLRDNEHTTDEEDDLSEMILSLQEWLEKGGFPPEDFRGTSGESIG